MPDSDDTVSGSTTAHAQKDAAKAGGSNKLSTSPQLGFPQMQQPHQSAPASTSARHSHTRSKSVNLSPTIGAAGPSFTPNTTRWEGLPSEPLSMPSSSSSSHSLSHLGPTARLGSPLLRPSSPLYVNVQGVSPTGNEFGRASPGSESGGSASSFSPDARRGMHFAKAMERSSSSGSIGSSSSSSNHLLPVSPRSSFSKRTASPSRVYAVPTSPRLRALGGSSHMRRSSSGSASHLSGNTGDNTISSSSALPIDADPGLPIDSVWPGGKESRSTGPPVGLDAIPIGVGKGQSTPIPPSLRDELSLDNLDNNFSTIYPRPASPNVRAMSVSPQDEFYLYRHHRTPSPSALAGSQKRRSSGSPAPGSPSPKIRPHSSPSLLPTLAAPKAISKRSFNLETGQYAPAQPSFINRRHGRTLSNSSSGSSRSDNDAADVTSVSPSKEEKNPTQKVLSPPEGAYAKLDAQNAIAEVSLGPSMIGSQGEAAEASDPSKNTGGEMEAEGSLSSLETTKAFASAHGIPFSDLPGNGRKYHSNLNGIVMIGPDGNLVRARSPAIASPRMETVPLGESPPKTRSFIGMPPRSGYDLSDDPDDVGSDSGSTGSGRNSINEDRENDDEEVDDIIEDQHEESQNHYRSPEEGRNDSLDRTIRPFPVPRRPSLTLAPVVAPAPVPGTNHEGADVQSWPAKELTAKRVDLGLTRDEGIDEDEDDEEADEEQDQESNESRQQAQNTIEPVPEESLSTLERIFLFAKSEMTYHRVLVSHSLAEWILEVELSDAVEFVIPLLNGLACDENDVCTAFAPHLHQVMWYFFRNCPLTEGDASDKMTGDEDGDVKKLAETDDDSPERATRPKISVGVFTPLLCALLLNYNAAIAGSTQSSIVRFFARLQGFDFLDSEEEENSKLPEEEQRQPQTQQFSSGKAQSKSPFDADTALIRDAAAREDKRVLLEDYDFSQSARQMIMDELLHHVALAIGNLNIEQTTHAREMTSHDEKSEARDMQSESNGEDAVMDDIPLTNEASLDVANEDITQTTSNGLSTAPILALNDSGDTEMSMDLLEESQEESLAAGRTSLGDNDSMTMSDVEEEVAVGRMASISLLAALGAEELVSHDFLIERIVPELVRSSADHTFFVRKEVAVAMGALAGCIGYQDLKQKDLLTTFERFCRDRIWHVRQAACLSLPNLFAQVRDAEVKRVKVIDTMRLFVNDVSHNVRVAALDIIGEMIYLFYEDPNGVPLELVRHFMGEPYDLKEEDGEGEAVNNISSSLETSGSESPMHQSQDSVNGFAGSWGGLRPSISTSNANGPTGWSSDSLANNSYKSTFHNADLMDSDRPLVMAYNFPAVMLTLGKAHWPKLKPVHNRLCNSISPKARRSLAASLHEIAKIIGVDLTSEDLLELVQHFLDSDIEKDEQVKMAMLQNLDVFVEQLTLDKALETLKYLLQLWNEESNGDPTRLSGNWRLREKVISLIPNLAKQYLMKDDEGVLVVLMQSAIVDSVSSVRAQGIRIVGSLYHIFEENDQVLADGFLGMLVDVGEHESYRGRVACLHCLTELCKNKLQRSSVEMLMMNRLVELSRDDVVDVRIALAQLVALMCRMDELYALPASRSEAFVNILRRLFYDRSELVGRIIISAVQEGDPGREPPNPWPSPRPTRELILGPSDGGLHRPPMSEHSFDMNGDSTGEVQSFDMDDEDDGQAQQDNILTSSSKEIPPLLDNSMLMKRRAHHRPHAQLDADSSMFEGADDNDNEESLEQEIASATSQEANTMLMPSADATGDDSFEGDDAHHLLGTAGDSPVRLTAPSEQNGLSLESPERPWNRSRSSSNNAETTTSNDAPDAQSHYNVNTNDNSKTADPFLAFVADKQYDRDGSSQQEQDLTPSKNASEAPARGQESKEKTPAEGNDAEQQM